MNRTLSEHDSAIWHTLHINDLIDAQRFHEVATVPTMFPPSLGPGERIVAQGGVVLNEFSALGDGSYAHDSGFFFATGRYGLALTAGVMAGRAVGNASRRKAARANAVPRWRPIDQGTVYVSDHGFCLHSNLGLRPWAWHDVTSSQLVGPRLVLLTGRSTSGPIQWILDSDWSELLFTMWARVRHPDHPQLIGGTWVPEGWGDRIAASTYAAPPSISGRWTPLMLPRGSA